MVLSLYADLTQKTLRIKMLLALICVVVMLSGCGSTTSPSWSVMREPATTNDPAQKPDIGWQNNNQRRESLITSANQPSMIPSPTAPAAAPSTQTVTVALLVPLTGEHSALGQSMLKAAQLAMVDLNAQNIKFISKDTAGTAEGATAAARAAKADKADLVLGPIFAHEVKAAKTVLNPTIPMIGFTTDWQLAGQNTYIMGFLPFGQVNRVTAYAISKGKRNFALLTPQNAYGDLIKASFQNALNAGGGTLVASQSFGADPVPAVTALAQQKKSAQKPNGFEAILIPLGGKSLQSAAALLSSQGIHPLSVQYMGTGLWDDASRTGEPAVEGGIYASPDPALRQSFEKRYLAAYGEAPMRLATLAYDATALAVILAKTQNAAEATFSANRLTTARGFSGIDGIFRFRNDGLAERGLAIIEVVPEGTRVIDPAPKGFAALP
jgi:ABC-type branched-subunit amino acid transport system substrate-binding protein